MRAKKSEATHKHKPDRLMYTSIPSVLQPDTGNHYPVDNDGGCSRGSDGSSKRSC